MQNNNSKYKTERIKHRGFDKSNPYGTDDTDKEIHKIRALLGGKGRKECF